MGRRQKRQTKIQYPIVRKQGRVGYGPVFFMHISPRNRQLQGYLPIEEQ